MQQTRIKSIFDGFKKAIIVTILVHRGSHLASKGRVLINQVAQIGGIEELTHRPPCTSMVWVQKHQQMMETKNYEHTQISKKLIQKSFLGRICNKNEKIVKFYKVKTGALNAVEKQFLL